MEEFSIELGAKLKLDSLQEQINKASSNLKPLEIRINTEKSEKKITALTEQISKLNNGFKIMENMGSLSSNLDVINKSLKSIATVVDKINKADGFNNLGKGLSNFAPVAEMIKNELSSIKTAMESFKGVNLNIGFGSTNNKTASDAANRMALAELRQQEAALESAYGGFVNMAKQLNSAKLWNFKTIADDATASMPAQIQALRQYINAILEINAVSAKGIDLTSVTSKFSGSADEIVTNTTKIATGEKALIDQTNQLKGLFGSGIDSEKLTAQLDAIKVSIDNVSTAISGIKFDDNTLNTFKETITSLNTAINQLSTSITELDNKPIISKTTTTGVAQTTQEIQKAEVETQKLKQTTEQIKPIGNALITPDTIKTFEEQVRQIIYDEKELEQITRDSFSQFGDVTTKTVKASSHEIESFVVTVKDSARQIEESLRFSLRDSSDGKNKLYLYQGSSGSDNYARQLESDRKQTERNTAVVTKYTSALQILQKEYLDVNASKPITNTENIEHLNSLYDKAITKVNALGTATKESFSSSEASVKAAIAELRSQVKIYREVESMANQLRAKPIETIREEQLQLLREFEAKIKSSGIAVEKLQQYSIGTLTSKLNGVTDKQSLTEYLNMFVVAKAEFKALQAEQKNYQQMQKASADKEKAALKEVENEYQNLISLVGQIGKLRVSLIGLDTEKDSQQITTIKSKLQELFTEYSRNKMNFAINFPTHSLDEINAKWKEILYNIQLAKSKVADTTAEKIQAETLKNYQQMQSQSVTKQKQQLAEVENEYQRIIQLVGRVGSTRNQLFGLDKNSPEYAIVKQRLADIYSEYSKLKMAFTTAYPTHNLDELNSKLNDVYYNTQRTNAHLSNQQAVKDETTAYKELLSSFDKYKAERIALSKINPENPKYDVVREEVLRLATDYRKLRDEFATAYPTHNIDELRDKLHSLGYELRQVQGDNVNKANQQAEKTEQEKVNSAYKETLDLLHQIQNIQVRITGLDPQKNSSEILALNEQLNRLQESYKSLRVEFNTQFNDSQVKKIKEASQATYDKMEVVKGKVADSQRQQAEKTEQEKVNSAYKETLSLIQQIRNIQTNLLNLDEKKDSNQILELEGQLKRLQESYQAIRQEFNSKFTSDQTTEINSALQTTIDKMAIVQAKIDDVKASIARSIKDNISNDTFKNQIQTLENDYRRLGLTQDEIAQKTQTLKSLLSTMDASDDIESVTRDYTAFGQEVVKVQNDVKALRREQQKQKDEANLANGKNALSSQIDVWLKKNSAAASQFGARLREIQQELLTADGTKLTALKREFQEIKRQAELTGKATMTLGDKLKSKLGSLATYFSATMMISYAIQGVRDMYNNVLEVDSAMTELYRVTDLTGQQYSQLYDNMVAGAKKYGVALNDIIESTASWVRLGFEANTASQLAEITAMYQHVTDLDNDTAVKNLVTAYKGYQEELLQVSDGDSTKAVTKIADAYDKLGNEFAVTAADVGESLRRSASSLEMAGNSFEEAAGMSTGIAEVTQNAEQAGTTLNVVSLRLRGMKGQLEEIGEEVDENVESISKMQTHILNLTNGKVNIFKDNGDFKSTYQIFKEISAIYDNLTDTSRADLLETVAGKQRSNAVAALISNWSNVEKAVEAASNSEGTAAAENEKYMQSMQGKLDSLNASWQALSNTVLSSDLIKFLVDGLSRIVDIVDSITHSFGVLGSTIATIGIVAFIKNLD